MATHSSILAWEMPWTKDPGGLQSMWLQKSLIQLSDQTNTPPADSVMIKAERGILPPGCISQSKEAGLFSG